VTDDDSLNKLFKFRPNPFMTTHDFLEKIIWVLFENYNAFIYPVYDITTDNRGYRHRNYTAFYPLNPTLAEFLQDDFGTLYVRFSFRSGYRSPAIPYSDIIHLRKKFSNNDIMGGGMNGQPDNAALLKTLAIDNSILEGVAKAIPTSLSVRGIVNLASKMNIELQKQEIQDFEQKVADSKDGILPLDVGTTFTPINMGQVSIDKGTLDFIENKILRWFGVSLPILSGDYTDNQKQAFYDKTIEGIVVGMTQAFTSTIFTPTEMSYGNELVFYYANLEMMSVESKKNIAEILGNRGAVTDNFLLQLFGLEPYDGGNVRKMSLNYIDSQYATDYQLARAGIDAKTPNQNGGNPDGET
jgi:phage portal protein BeeE